MAEDWILPAVIQLNGIPTATEDGDILYVFPVRINESPFKIRKWYKESFYNGAFSVHVCLRTCP